jgi:hypothetical protein
LETSVERGALAIRRGAGTVLLCLLLVYIPRRIGEGGIERGVEDTGEDGVKNDDLL